MALADKRLRNINAALSTDPYYNGGNYEEYTTEAMQSKINAEFLNSTDIFTIGEELTKGTLIFSDTIVRIVHIVKGNTGIKLGDDFKEIIFQDLTHTLGMGYRYSFDTNIWITINSDYYHYVTKSTIIKRCNNTLKWKNSNGKTLQEPCIIDYDLKQYGVDYNPNIILPDGTISVTVQYNDITKTISINDRFLFGGQAFKVKAMNNFLNHKTYDNTTPPLIYLYMVKDNLSPYDDLINNIPDTNKYVYTLNINQEPFEQVIGYNGQLTATVTLNGEEIVVPLTWSSSDTAKATINATTGAITLVASGTVIFTATMTNNTAIFDTVSVVVKASPTTKKQIIITPDQTEILQGKHVDYSVYKYTNDVIGADTFIITASGVPLEYYSLVVLTGNTFKVTCLKYYATNPLMITCTSNLDATSETISIVLKGVW